MNPDRIFFNLSFEFTEGDTFDDADPAISSNNEYLTELVIDDNEYYLKIFYENADQVERKIMGWHPSHAHSILTRFKVTKVVSPNRLLMIEFGTYHITGMKSSTANQEFGQNYFIVSLEGVRLIYDHPEREDCEIYLSRTAFKLIEIHYKYNAIFHWQNDFKWHPENAANSFIDFNKVQFHPEHNFYHKNSNHGTQVTFEKEPRLRIKHEHQTSDEILKHTDLICDMYSLYCNKQIKWKVARIYAEGKLVIDRRQVVSEENDFAHGIFIWDFIQNPLNLIRNVDPGKVMNNAAFISRIVNQYMYSFKLSGESKFMILYSILEQLRNKYIEHGEIEPEANGNWRKVKQEYTFSASKAQRDKTIRQALESIIPAIIPEEQQLFNEEIPHKMSGIVLMSMQHQFVSYFQHIQIDPANYNIDFNELKSLRNKVFHGGDISGEAEIVEKVNWYEHFPRFIGVLILRFCGIEDLMKMNLTRPK